MTHDHLSQPLLAMKFDSYMISAVQRISVERKNIHIIGGESTKVFINM